MNAGKFGVLAVEFHNYAIGKSENEDKNELFKRWSEGQGRRLLEVNGVTSIRTLQESTLDEVLDVVCCYFNEKRPTKSEFALTIADIMSKKRPRYISEPRHICMHLAYKYVSKGLDVITQEEIGDFFKVDRTIVTYANKKIAGLVEFDNEFRTVLYDIENRLKNRLMIESDNQEETQKIISTVSK